MVDLQGEVDMLKIGNAGKSDSATSLLNRSPLSCILRAKGKNLIRKKLEQTKIVLYDRTQTYDRINDLRWVGLRSCQSRKSFMTSPQIWLESWKRLQWINGLKMNRECIVTVCLLAFYTECILLPRLTVTKGSDSLHFLYSKRNALKYNTERKKIVTSYIFHDIFNSKILKCWTAFKMENEMLFKHQSVLNHSTYK